jgi:lipoyl(octanoyl) transferase
VLFVLDPPLSAAENMERDWQFFQKAEKEQTAILRFYSWEKPSLSLGYRQNIYEFDFPEVVQRFTGGGAVLHLPGELTYALAVPLNKYPIPKNILPAASQLSSLFIKVLENLGLSVMENIHQRPERLDHPLCFVQTAPYEISCQGKKLIGAAQRRSRQTFFQHGSLGIPRPENFWEIVPPLVQEIREKQFYLSDVLKLNYLELANLFAGEFRKVNF